MKLILYDKKSNILLFTILLIVYFFTNPFRQHYWSSDHEYLILHNVLNLSFQSIQYDHTGLATFLIIKLFFTLVSFFSDQINSNYENFIILLDENKLSRHIFFLRFINFILIYFTIFFLFKIIKYLTNNLVISLIISASIIFSKPFMSLFFEVRTDTISILLFCFAIYLATISCYRYIISFILTLTYFNKVNFLPYILFFPFIKIMLKKKLQDVELDFYNVIVILFGLWVIIYYILFFNISINNLTSLNTQLNLSSLAYFYQVLIFLIIVFSYKSLGFEFKLNYFYNALYGISLSIILATFFIDKYILTLIFNPFEHMTRYSSVSDGFLDFLKKLFYPNKGQYYLLFKDNFYLIFIISITLILNFFKIINNKYNLTDLIPICIFLMMNFQFLRGYFVRYETPILFLLIIYLCHISTYFKQKVIFTISLLLLLISLLFPFKVLQNDVSYQPFISQDIEVACHQGRDWIKGKFGNYLESLCQ